MDSSLSVDMVRQALLTSLLLCAPVLIAGAVTGLLTGLLQTITQVHDQTLSFVPKMAVVLIVLALFLPWLLQRLAVYATTAFSRVPFL